MLIDYQFSFLTFHINKQVKYEKCGEKYWKKYCYWIFTNASWYYHEKRTVIKHTQSCQISKTIFLPFFPPKFVFWKMGILNSRHIWNDFVHLLVNFGEFIMPNSEENWIFRFCTQKMTPFYEVKLFNKANMQKSIK